MAIDILAMLGGRMRMPAAATDTTTATPTSSPLIAPSPTPTISQFSAVGPLAMSPSEVTAHRSGLSPLSQLFNFPTLRKKASMGMTGGASASGGIGNYNENFWNSWRV